jgi:crossover junction endodeoxyribonuclease RuvC
MKSKVSHPIPRKVCVSIRDRTVTTAVFVGIDPGLSGAVAFYDPLKSSFHVVDMPTKWVSRNGKRRRQIDCVELGTVLDLYTSGRDVRAFVEQVNAMPGQGVISMFSFGRAAGVVDGELGAMGVDPVYVLPRVWQARAGLAPKCGKDEHRALAKRVWPKHWKSFERAKDDGRADAALILRYGLSENGIH